MSNKRNALLAKMGGWAAKALTAFLYQRDWQFDPQSFGREKAEATERFTVCRGALQRRCACHEKTVLTWIKWKIRSQSISGKQYQKVSSAFSHWEGEKIQVVEWENFYKEFERQYNQECRNRFPIDSTEYQKAVSVRKAPPSVENRRRTARCKYLTAIQIE